MNIFSWLKPKPKHSGGIQRAPRLVILPFFPLHFVTPDGKDLLVANISTSGVGFQRASFTTVPEKGSILEGKLRLQEKSYALKLRVMHASPSIVGCLIEPAHEEYSRDLNGYLDVELSAIAAREIDSQILKQDPEGKPHWYVGRQNACELFFVERDGELKSFHCTIWGHYFESKKIGHKRIGVVSDASSNASSGSNIHPQSALIEDVQGPAPQLTEMAMRFISNIPALNEAMRKQIIQRLQ